MKYVTVYYQDGNRECGAIYYGVSAETAKEMFRMEFPETACLDLQTKVYEEG
ncbi:MAG: hypothetical protein IJ917_09585 [Firmicutes bacterium]|nr:hypothetical protein [Bacillota bacterium]